MLFYYYKFCLRAIRLQSATSVIISYNYVEDVADNGVYLYGTTNVKVNSNNITVDILRDEIQFLMEKVKLH